MTLSNETFEVGINSIAINYLGYNLEEFQEKIGKIGIFQVVYYNLNYFKMLLKGTEIK